MIGGAMFLAARGWHLLPCVPDGKRPATKRGLKAATDDPNVLRALWDRDPAFNPGVHCGRSGLVVFDLDQKNGVDGERTLIELVDRIGELPPTRTARTPSGGLHLYYASGADLGPSVGRVGEIEARGIDIRAGESYVLAPPSIVGGRRYHWEVSAPCAPLPQAWIAALTPKPFEPTSAEPPPVPQSKRRCVKYLRAALEGERDKLLHAPEGTRHDTLNRYAFSLGQLVEAGLRREDIIASAEWVFSRWAWAKRPDMRAARRTLERGIADGMKHSRSRIAS